VRGVTVATIGVWRITLVRSIVRLGIVLTLACFFLTILVVASASFAMAQGVGTTQISGVVLDAQRNPVGGARVRLSGPVSKTTSTAANGSFAFHSLPAGIFRLDITKAGFNSDTQESIVEIAGSTTVLSFTLEAASLTSLTTIATVSSHSGANSINTAPASIVDVPASTFIQQGQLSMNQVLNEEPGITMGVENGIAGPNVMFGNASSPLAAGIPSIRGGLPYETESLIDGHPISLGQYGFFSPSFISPYELQNVEVVKGPGATSPSINYAINGTVNYRTLEPTVKPEESADFGMDQYGGNFANVRATGTLPGDRWSYAFDYVTDGTQGFARGDVVPSFFLATRPAYLNGSPVNLNAGFHELTNSPPNIQNSVLIEDPLVGYTTLAEAYNERNELGKIRYAFTPSTTLTLTWLGAQEAAPSAAGWSFYDGLFDPPAGYSGSLPAGPVADTSDAAVYNPQVVNQQETNLFETEFHTPLGKTATLLLRQYSSSIQGFVGGPGNSGPTAAPPVTFTTPLYGAVYYGATNTTTPTIFNGQVGTLTLDQYSETRSYDHLTGYTAEIDKQAGDDLLSLSYDYEKTSTLATAVSTAGVRTTAIPAGSSQSFESLMGRAQFELGQRVNGTLSDNFGSYTDTYSQNGGASFLQSTHTYQAPRLSMTWQPNPNESVRASAGLSVAPPFINLLNNSENIVATGSPVFYYTETGNSGDVLPETAFGFDIGLDARLHSPFTVLSVDLYQTVLHNQFLPYTFQDGTYTCPSTCASYNVGDTAPLYITRTVNLGHSKYEGVELSLHRTPPTGWGYRIQGSLMRAFAYDLPTGFYNTATCTNCTNLGILPNENFQPSGDGYNGLGYSRIPYSTGYGELNYRAHNGAHFLAGITYYGPNNFYNEPAFEVVTASFDQPLTRRSSLQLSIYNLTNAYPNFYYVAIGVENTTSILTPLENGKEGYASGNVVGPSTARLIWHIDL
jgi:hypothetical protein